MKYIKLKSPLLSIGILVLMLTVILTFWVYLSVSKPKESVKNVNDITSTALVTSDDPSFGNPTALVQLVEFSDFQCPYCADAAVQLSQIKAVYGDKIHFVYRDFPISGHAFALKAAEASECAQDQGKFWEMHDAMFANQGQLDVDGLKRIASDIGLDAQVFATCLDSGQYASEVRDDFQAGRAFGVEGTPTLFINGSPYRSLITFEGVSAVIDQILQ